MAAIWQNPVQKQERIGTRPEVAILSLVSVIGILLSGLYVEAVLDWLARLVASAR
jgi:hypothetical protein